VTQPDYLQDENTACLSSAGQPVFEPWESTDFQNERIRIREFCQSVLFCTALPGSREAGRLWGKWLAG